MSEVLVEVWRGSFLECQHRGHAVIVNSRGDILESWGNPTQEILPRSACKILQALPLVESGAADAYGLTLEHLALSCGTARCGALMWCASRIPGDMYIPVVGFALPCATHSACEIADSLRN